MALPTLLAHASMIMRFIMRQYILIFTILSCLVAVMLYTPLLRNPVLSHLKLTSTTTSTTTNAMRNVIVVGSGLAGLSASHAALAANSAVHVHLLERAPKPGGNSIKASSGINGAGTRYQLDAGVTTDSSQLFFKDTTRSAGVRYTEDRAPLVSKLTAESTDAVNWLATDLGVDLSVVARLGGHSAARTHRGAGKPPGASIVSALLANLTAQPERFTISYNTDVTALLQRTGGDRGVYGVEYVREGEPSPATLEGPVVFASGGFAGDPALLATHAPELAGMPSTNDARKASHAILTAAGARLLDMDSVQIHPTGFVEPAHPDAPVKFLAAEMLRGEGGILLAGGKRFVNELDTRAHVSAAIMALPSKNVGDVRQWDITLVLDPGAAAAAASHLGFYTWKGLMRKVKLRDLDADTVAAVDAYSAGSADEQDPFGRPARGNWTLAHGDHDAEMVVGTITPVVHFTMGGVQMDSGARVLGPNGTSIPGLYAAGEITGGIHGDNRLGGSSLLECAVYGRTAGAAAATQACDD